MPVNDSDSKIRELTDEFVSQLSVVIREAALEAVRDAIEGVGGSPTPTRRKKKAGRRKAKATRRTSGNGRRKKRTRRTAADYSALGDQILAYVKANPGCGAGEIAEAVGSTTTAIRPVTAELIAAKQLRTTGQRRGTKYFAGAGGGGGGRKKAGSKKATSRKKAARRKTGRKKASSSAKG